jgi:hypothetical protein
MTGFSPFGGQEMSDFISSSSNPSFVISTRFSFISRVMVALTGIQNIENFYRKKKVNGSQFLGLGKFHPSFADAMRRRILTGANKIPVKSVQPRSVRSSGHWWHQVNPQGRISVFHRISWPINHNLRSEMNSYVPRLQWWRKERPGELQISNSKVKDKGKRPMLQEVSP